MGAEYTASAAGWGDCKRISSDMRLRIIDLLQMLLQKPRYILIILFTIFFIIKTMRFG